jgi:hypothetical protein
MLTAVLKTVKMLFSCCPKNSQYAVVLTALKAVQDDKKNQPHKDQYKELFSSSRYVKLKGEVIWKQGRQELIEE